MIPMVNLQAQYNAIRHEIKQALDPVMDSCCYILGPNVEAFEREAADYLGVRHAIGVASGTDALQLALLAEGIGEGDEVITTPFTFIATAEAIRHVGATPVFVDIDPRTFNIDPDAVERAISTKTRAVMVVHLFGQPADMPRLSALCRQHDIRLIEDCCQSFGAAIDGTKTGAFGDGAGFSFFPSKNLGAFGDGGLYVTHSDAAAAVTRNATTGSWRACRCSSPMKPGPACMSTISTPCSPIIVRRSCRHCARPALPAPFITWFPSTDSRPSPR